MKSAVPAFPGAATSHRLPHLAKTTAGSSPRRRTGSLGGAAGGKCSAGGFSFGIGTDPGRDGTSGGTGASVVPSRCIGCRVNAESEGAPYCVLVVVEGCPPPRPPRRPDEPPPERTEPLPGPVRLAGAPRVDSVDSAPLRVLPVAWPTCCDWSAAAPLPAAYLRDTLPDPPNRGVATINATGRERTRKQATIKPRGPHRLPIATSLVVPSQRGVYPEARDDKPRSLSREGRTRWGNGSARPPQTHRGAARAAPRWVAGRRSQVGRPTPMFP